MADAEREARVKITTVHEGTGAAQVAKDFNELEKAQQANDKASKESAKSTDDLASKKKALREVVKGLALEVPGLARVIGLLANPYTVLAAVLGTVIGKLMDWNAQVDAAAQRQAAIQSLDATITSMARTIAEFKADAFADEMKRTTDGAKEAAEGVKGLNAEIEFNQQLQDQLQDKGLALGKARIKQRVSRGEISAVQGMELSMQLEDQVRQDKMRREEAAESQKLNNMAVALKRAEGVTPLSAEEMARAKREAESQAAKAGDSQKTFSGFATAQEKLIADLGAELAASMTRNISGSANITPGRTLKAAGRGAFSNEAIRKTIEDDIASAEAELGLQGRLNEDRQVQADESRRRFELMQQEQERRQEIIRMRGPLRDEFETQSRRATARHGARRQGAAIERATGAATVGAAQAEADADAAREARQLQQQQNSKVNSAIREALIRNGADDVAETLELIKQLTDVQKNHKDKINQLRDRVNDNRID